MKIGLQIYHFEWPGGSKDISSELEKLAKTAEKAGFYSLWVPDHFFRAGGIWGSVEAPQLEGYSTISYLAAVTQKIKVGLMVTCNIQKNRLSVNLRLSLSN
jgi:alkanesulfonate monooxygenase SsuD/methylene tetrahydromethanopterin reductase-like flavin-dependent oxidoreductase (luciferase family)